MQSLDQTQAAATAKLLRAHKQEIFDLWVTKARASVDSARQTPRTRLIDHLPKFLDEMADRLDSSPEVSEAAAGTLSAVHGQLRAEEPPSYTVGEMLKEYRLLREVIYEVLERPPAVRLPFGIRDFLASSIERAKEIAAEAFTLERSAGLQKDKEAAENTIRRHETFVASLSHDLRNPLGAISMAFELLEEELGNTQNHAEVLAIIKRNLGRTERMISDLLDVARVKSGHGLQLNRAMGNLVLIAKEAVNDMAPDFSGRLHLTAPETIEAYFDQDAIRRALDNLLTNAIKYSEMGTPITVAVRTDDAVAEISVHNEGHVIADDAKKSLFEPFWRNTTDANDGKEGWGLGLALVSEVLKAHGGQVHVESSAAAGTTFSLRVPRSH